MLVAITGANGQIGAGLLARLRSERDIRCTALVRRPEGLPADEVVADWMSAERTREVLGRADWVVHLAGSLAPPGGDYETANTTLGRFVADAVAATRRAGIVFLSYVGADEGSTNPYLRTKAACERVLRAATDRAIIFRCTHIVGSPSRPGPTAEHFVSKKGSSVNVLGRGDQKVSPIFAGDVVEAIAAAVRRPQPGTYELAGPKTMTMDELVRALNSGRVIRIRHVSKWLATVLQLFTPDLSRPLIEVMCADSTGDPSAAVAAFGLKLTPLSATWRSPR